MRLSPSPLDKYVYCQESNFLSILSIMGFQKESDLGLPPRGIPKYSIGKSVFVQPQIALASIADSWSMLIPDKVVFLQINLQTRSNFRRINDEFQIPQTVSIVRRKEQDIINKQ